MLEIKVSAGLRTGTFSKGLAGWPVDAAFQYSESAQSFCICIKEEIDAGPWLEELTGQAGAKEFTGCRLSGAGVFYRHSSGEKKEPGDLPELLALSVTEEQAESLRSLLEDPKVSGTSGVCLWMAADLKELDVLSDLIRLGYEGGESLLLLGYLGEDEGSRVWTLYARLPDIELFSSLLLKDILLIYRRQGDGHTYFALSGQVSVRIEERRMQFAGEIEMSNAGYRGTLSSCGTQEGLSFTAGAEGCLPLRDLAFHIEYAYAGRERPESKQYYLQGSLSLGDILLSGKVFWQETGNGADGYLTAGLGTDLSLESLLHALFSGYEGGGALFHMAFLEGSRLICYFGEKKGCLLELKAALDVAGRLELTGTLAASQEGFRVSLSADTALCLGPFRLEPAGDENRLEVSLQYQKDDPASGRQLDLTAGASFLGKQLLAGTFSYRGTRNGWSLWARLQMPDSLTALFGSHLTLVYDSAEGFHLEDLEEISYLGEAVDFLKQLKKYMQMGKTGACKELQECAGQEHLHSSFSFTPGLSGSLGQESSVKITLKGVLRVEDQDQNLLLERRLGEEKELAVQWTSGMTADALLKQVETMLEEAVKQILEALFQEDSFEELAKILKVVAEGKLKEYAEGLLCRKLISESNAEKLKASEPGEGGSTGGSEQEAGFEEIAAGGGTAFGGGTVMEGAGDSFGGLIVIAFAGSTGEDRKQGEKLSCPAFSGQMEDTFLKIEMQQVKDATGYEMDFRWDSGGRKDEFIPWETEKGPPGLSLLGIPVKGRLYLAVRALYGADPSLNSDWSPGNLVGEVTARDIVLWSRHQSLCIRDCFQALEEHGFQTQDENVLKLVLQQYMTPKMKEDLVREHFEQGDPAAVCLEHLIREFPHLTSGEILKCMWYEGYQEPEIIQALLTTRQGLKAEELEGLLEKMIKLEEATMDIKVKLTEILKQRENTQLTEQEFLSEIKMLVAADGLLEVARALKEQGISAMKLAEYMAPCIPEKHKAAALGELILDPDIYPATSRDDMEKILQAVYPGEKIEQALEILYPVLVTVRADLLWQDTNVTVADDEIVTVRYLCGKWKVNPQHEEPYDAAGRVHTFTPVGYVLAGVQDGCLVGKIDDGSPFYIGKKQEVPQGQGKLYLIANDDIKRYYGVGHADNEGEISVMISKEYR